VPGEPHEFELGVHEFDSVEIVEPDPLWPDQFRQIAEEIAAIAESGVRRLDHIGSTSVPGLRSKNRIDIQVTVDNLDAARAWVGKLARLGFAVSRELSRDHQPHDDAYAQEKLFLHKSRDLPFANVHVREWRRGSWHYALLMRDYLRVHDSVADTYGSIKARLVDAVDGRRTLYSYVKDAVCDLIVVHALEWANRSQWDVAAYNRRNLVEWRKHTM
jgi:dephospho-CoA kinase